MADLTSAGGLGYGFQPPQPGSFQFPGLAAPFTPMFMYNLQNAILPLNFASGYPDMVFPTPAAAPGGNEVAAALDSRLSALAASGTGLKRLMSPVTVSEQSERALKQRRTQTKTSEDDIIPLPSSYNPAPLSTAFPPVQTAPAHAFDPLAPGTQPPFQSDATVRLSVFPAYSGGANAGGSVMAFRPGKAAAPTTRRARLPTKSNKAVASSQDGTFSSLYRGVTRHRLTGRFEAHFWDASFQRPVASKSGRTRGKQVYVGGWTNEEDAARAYDKASLSYLGAEAKTNFPLSDYADFLVEIAGKTPEEVVGSVRRGAVGFARGRSPFRGVNQLKDGNWEARHMQSNGGATVTLGKFDTADQAARAVDIAAVRQKGRAALTNFNISEYEDILAAGDTAQYSRIHSGISATLGADGRQRQGAAASNGIKIEPGSENSSVQFLGGPEGAFFANVGLLSSGFIPSPEQLQKFHTQGGSVQPLQFGGGSSIPQAWQMAAPAPDNTWNAVSNAAWGALLTESQQQLAQQQQGAGAASAAAQGEQQQQPEPVLHASYEARMAFAASMDPALWQVIAPPAAAAAAAAPASEKQHGQLHPSSVLSPLAVSLLDPLGMACISPLTSPIAVVQQPGGNGRQQEAWCPLSWLDNLDLTQLNALDATNPSTENAGAPRDL